MPVDTSVSKGKNAYIAEQVMAIADVETVAEYLGLEMRRYGSKISILCPCHNDQHFKSCYLTKKGFVCYSCNTRGDMIRLVQRTLNVSFLDACNYILEIYGQKIENIDCDKPLKQILKSEDLNLIGLGQPDEDRCLYRDLATFETPDDVDLEDGQRFKWIPGKFIAPGNVQNEDDLYVLQEIVSRNPLRDLLNENEPAYNDLVFRKAQEASEKYQLLLDMAVNPNRYLESNNIVECYFALKCIEVVKCVGVKMWTEEMTRRIRRCDDIRIEFRGTQATQPATQTKPKKRKSVFGKIKTGGSYI